MLADAILGALPELQAHAEARMTSRVAIMRKTSLTEQDETSGLEVPVWATIYADLPARFPPTKGGASSSRAFNAGGVELTLGVRELHVPYATEGLLDGDLAEVTVGRAQGSVWHLVDATPPADQATAYRLDVVATDRPEEWA